MSAFLEDQTEKYAELQKRFDAAVKECDDLASVIEPCCAGVETRGACDADWFPSCSSFSRRRYFAETSSLKFEALFTIFSDFLSSYRSAELDVRAKAKRLQAQQRQQETRAAMRVNTKTPTLSQDAASNSNLATKGISSGSSDRSSCTSSPSSADPPVISESLLSAAIAAAIASPAVSVAGSMVFGQAEARMTEPDGHAAGDAQAEAEAGELMTTAALSSAPSTPPTSVPSTPTAAASSPALTAAFASPSSRLSAKNALSLGTSTGGTKSKRSKRKGSGIAIAELAD